VHVELAVEALEVLFDRAWSDDQARGDFFVPEAGGQQPEYLELARGRGIDYSLPGGWLRGSCPTVLGLVCHPLSPEGVEQVGSIARRQGGGCCVRGVRSSFVSRPVCQALTKGPTKVEEDAHVALWSGEGERA
jgi:hypothetical protein